MIRRPPRSTQSRSSAASDVYKRQGSLVQLGIGPIVTASIILQLFKGADIIKLDTSDPRDQSVYQQLQKLLIFVMIVVEALPQVLGCLLYTSDAADDLLCVDL